MRDRATDTPCLPCLHPDAALEITRNDILRRDLTDLTFKDGSKSCSVQTGTLRDPYTNKTIAFTRGHDTSSAVQIDHLLSAALSRSLPLSAGHYVDDMPLTAVVAL